MSSLLVKAEAKRLLDVALDAKISEGSSNFLKSILDEVSTDFTSFLRDTTNSGSNSINPGGSRDYTISDHGDGSSSEDFDGDDSVRLSSEDPREEESNRVRKEMFLRIITSQQTGPDITQSIANIQEYQSQSTGLLHPSSAATKRHGTEDNGGDLRFSRNQNNIEIIANESSPTMRKALITTENDDDIAVKSNFDNARINSYFYNRESVPYMGSEQQQQLNKPFYSAGAMNDNNMRHELKRLSGMLEDRKIMFRDLVSLLLIILHFFS